MFELVHLAAAYVIGTAAGLWLFRTWIQERIVTATLDTLIRDGYLCSWVDDDGVTQLSKLTDLQAVKSELEIIDEMTPEDISKILDELIAYDEQEKARKDNEEDDT